MTENSLRLELWLWFEPEPEKLISFVYKGCDILPACFTGEINRKLIIDDF